MDNVRKKNWFSITAYVVILKIVITVLLQFAETYFPSKSSNLVPRQSDRISRWIVNSPPWQNSRGDIKPAVDGQQEMLLLLLNQKKTAGKTELVYRGLVGKPEFQIDLIIPEVDPQVS